MTLAIAWVRKVGKHKELVIASDSRLGGGEWWDCGPKVVLLPRSDCLIGFAGETERAYPLMLQLRNYLEGYPKANSRAMDFLELKGHVTRMFTEMWKQLHNLPKGAEDLPKVELIFAGYSWSQRRFRIFSLSYQKPKEDKKETEDGTKKKEKSEMRMVATSRGSLYIAGNPEAVVVLAQKRIQTLLTQRKKNKDSFDFEPFEALREIIRNNEHDAVGGPPQIVRIFEHMNCKPMAVYWPDRASGQRTLLGRNMLTYEQNTHFLLDPDTLETDEPTQRGTPRRRLGKRIKKAKQEGKKSENTNAEK